MDENTRVLTKATFLFEGLLDTASDVAGFARKKLKLLKSAEKLIDRLSRDFINEERIVKYSARLNDEDRRGLQRVREEYSDNFNKQITLINSSLSLLNKLKKDFINEETLEKREFLTSKQLRKFKYKVKNNPNLFVATHIKKTTSRFKRSEKLYLIRDKKEISDEFEIIIELHDKINKLYDLAVYIRSRMAGYRDKPYRLARPTVVNAEIKEFKDMEEILQELREKVRLLGSFTLHEQVFF